MNNTLQKLLLPAVWLIGIISFISLSIELFLFQIADYNVYRVLTISFPDLLILILILTVQYLLMKSVPFHINAIWQASGKGKNNRYFLIILALFGSGVYALLPSQFPFWIFFVLLGVLILFTIGINYWAENPFHKVIFLLLFGAGLNSSLIFWMHEESNAGRKISYAQQLAERQDTIAENILFDFAELGKNLPSDFDKNDFWEKQWIQNAYLNSNYSIIIEEFIADATTVYYQPILTIDAASIPVYTIFSRTNYTINFKQKTDFRRSIYTQNKPFKNLKDLNSFQFAVIDKSKIVLSNSHAFDPYILDIKLPPIGEGEKIELEGFDVLAYRHAQEVFVLIGEPLSEVQVWMSNFAFFFSLLLSIAILIKIISLLLLRQKIIDSWQELPIQFRIQIILMAITCALFFIIATTTFFFLHQNNLSISHERQVYISETLREEILEEQEQYGWNLEDFSIDFLAELAYRNQCDIDFFRPDGTLINNSFATAQNNTDTISINKNILQQIKQNFSLILVERQYAKATNEPYLRTYFGIFQEDELEGIASVSSFESEIGTSPYIPIVMVKLLNVYVFLLLLSWGGGLLLIGLLTQPLELLANRLSNFKLGEVNEKLHWKGEDAIGQLIAEYNKMVDKVETTTKELIRSEREGAWQVMAQQIAHEINNKLTPLCLNIQFLTRLVDGLNPKESETIQRITMGLEEKIDGLSKTATQFQLFAKLDTPEVQPIELKRYIQQFLNKYKPQESIQYELFIDLEEGQETVINIDTRHLQEVLNNIVSNAEHSIPENRKGMIALKLKKNNSHIIIEIEDNGKGIDANIIENIFDPKFSVISSQTGLGLPICKRIIEFYNGDLTFKTTIDEGTSFIITFPFSKK